MFIFLLLFIFHHFNREISTSFCGGSGDNALALLYFVKIWGYMRQDRRLWIWIYPWISTENLRIWIWMRNFISKASLLFMIIFCIYMNQERELGSISNFLSGECVESWFSAFHFVRSVRALTHDLWLVVSLYRMTCEGQRRCWDRGRSLRRWNSRLSRQITHQPFRLAENPQNLLQEK